MFTACLYWEQFLGIRESVIIAQRINEGINWSGTVTPNDPLPPEGETSAPQPTPQPAPADLTIPEIVVNPVPRTGGGAGSVRAENVELFIAQDKAIDETRLRTLTDPFTRLPADRPLASDFIRPDAPRNTAMLRQFVTPERLDALWKQVEELQKKVVKRVSADRGTTDAYHLDLLFASSLLLQSSANYEEVRQIAYRIEADLVREELITGYIKKYRPRLLLYSVICVLLSLLALSLDPLYRNLVPETLGILKMAWLPMMFGALGATFNGMMSLHEHTIVRRDFDPIHISWYILNPFVGAVMGLIVFIFFVVTSTTFNPEIPNPERAAPMVIWLLGFAVGWQQNLVFRLLNRVLKTFVAEDEKNERVPASRISVPPPSGNDQPLTR